MHEKSKNHHVGVMITTFRRPRGLIQTLDSLAQQEWRDGTFEVHVIDNEGNPAVEAIVRGFARRTQILTQYHRENVRGVASARNRALAALTDTMEYLAFIDDDEVASPLWLSNLIKTAVRFDASIVQGPVEPVYEADAPAWFRKARITALGPFRDGEELRFGFSGNVLLSCAMLRESGVQFDPRFDRSGGEDQHFFMMLMQRGYRIVTSRDAFVFETIPLSRVSLRDFVKRRFRIGATLTVAWRLLRNERIFLVKRVVIGAGHAGLGALAFLLPWRWTGEDLATNLGRIAYGCGQVAGISGLMGSSYETVHRSEIDSTGAHRNG